MKTAVYATQAERCDHYPDGETWAPGASGDQHRRTGAGRGVGQRLCWRALLREPPRPLVECGPVLGDGDTQDLTSRLGALMRNACRPLTTLVLLMSFWSGVGDTRALAGRDSWSHCGLDWLVAPDIHRHREALLAEFGIEPLSSFVIVLVIPETGPEWALRLGLTAEGNWTLSHFVAGSSRRAESQEDRPQGADKVPGSERAMREEPEALAVWGAFRREMLRLQVQENQGIWLRGTRVEVYVTLVGAPMVCAEQVVPADGLPEGPLGDLIRGMLEYAHGEEEAKEKLAHRLVELAQRVP